MCLILFVALLANVPFATAACTSALDLSTCIASGSLTIVSPPVVTMSTPVSGVAPQGVVNWTTSVPVFSTAQVQVHGAPPPVVKAQPTPTLTSTPSITLTDLVPGTSYDLIVTSVDPQADLAIAPPAPAVVSFTVASVPSAPTIGTATGGSAQAIVNFTAPANNGGSAITGYTVTCIPAGGVDSNAGSPSLTHTITGLTNGTSYTFTVHAINAIGNSVESAASNAITPVASVVNFTVSTNAGANGNISPASQTVAQGNTTSFTVTPNSGYTASASGCGGSLSGSTYTTGIITASCTVSATFTNSPIPVSLVTGWNLLGNGVNAPLDVSALGNATQVTTVWKWEPTGTSTGITYPAWAFYAPSLASSGTLASYAASKGYDVLTTINAGEGFWVNAKTAFSIQLPAGATIASSTFADQTTPPNKLPQGWSLIATGDYPSPKVFVNTIATNPPTAGTAATSLTTLWAWDSGNANWYFYAPSLDNSGTLTSYITNKNYEDFTKNAKTLDPATGFWVNHP